ncbi:MAG: hypothetical protein RL033_7295 [Pseudomonadota bacterium]|jgi:serine/threonine-protein kinase
MSAPPRILGEKYQLIRPLEQGGMGSVWLAEHLSLASPVAVKLMAAELGTSEELRQRFLREAHAAAALRSPHVVQTLDYGVDGDTPYIVMELLEGESLAARLTRQHRLSPQETELVLRHVSRAVARAHELGIVHRDLKPANIFITHNDEEEVIKLFDFGIVKAMTDAGEAAQTRTGSLLGTPAYMSPEQLEGKHCDYSADIWAMGVIAYQCLLGQPPFAGAGLGGLVRAVTSEPLPVPSEHGLVPEGFEGWFARACARDPGERFASAREAAQELRRVLTPELDGADAEPPTTEGAERPRAPAATERWPSAPPGLEEAFPLRARVPQASEAPASATVRGSGGQRPLPLVPALFIVAIGLLLFAGYRSFEPPDGLAQVVAEVAPLQPRSSGVAPTRELAGASIVPRSDLAAAPLVRAAEGPQAAAPDGAAPSRAAPSRAAPSRAAVPREAVSRAAPSSKAGASLTITSSPLSHVLLDGTPQGSTPLHSLRVRPGKHRVTLIHGKQRKTMHVETSAGENTLLSARFSSPEVAAIEGPVAAP